MVQETTGTAQSGGQPAAHHFSGKEVQDTTGLHLLEILYPLMYWVFLFIIIIIIINWGFF